ncbi:MAG: hypothetical protein JO250_09490 [Armatimonadetes bacterium]|nr:hypothetical protein [Armatimonadota bacterium]
MTLWRRGDFVELNGRVAVVVGVEGDPDVPEEHVALWFGEASDQRATGEDPAAGPPQVWTVPAEYCRPGPRPVYRH